MRFPKAVGIVAWPTAPRLVRLTRKYSRVVANLHRPCYYEKARPSSRLPIPCPLPKHSVSPTLLFHDISKSSRNIRPNPSLNEPTQLNVQRLADPRPQTLVVESLLDGSILEQGNRLLRRGLRSRMTLQKVGRSWVYRRKLCGPERRQAILLSWYWELLSWYVIHQGILNGVGSGCVLSCCCGIFTYFWDCNIQ